MISVFLWRRVLYFPISLQYISKVLHSILQKCCRLLWNYSNLLQCFRNCQDKNSLEETLYFDPLFSRFHFTMFLCFFIFFPSVYDELPAESLREKVLLARDTTDDIVLSHDWKIMRRFFLLVKKMINTMTPCRELMMSVAILRKQIKNY